jgi:hypothetical protein
MGSYSPKKPLEIASGWRGEAVKKADGSDDAALMRQVCSAEGSYPTK